MVFFEVYFHRKLSLEVYVYNTLRYTMMYGVCVFERQPYKCIEVYVVHLVYRIVPTGALVAIVKSHIVI